MASVAAVPEAVAPPHSALRKSAPAFGAGLLVLAASVFNFLAYHDYPFARAEVLLLLLGVAAIAALYWAVYHVSSDLGRALAEAALVYLAIDLNSEYFFAAIVAATLVGVARWWKRLSALPVLSIVAAVVLVSAFVGLAEKRPPILRQQGAATPLRNAPAVLHLIVDEHGGIAGIPDPEVRAALTDFYERNGFRLFPRAYSRHFHTVNAIPDILNFGGRGESTKVGQTLDIGRTAYLSRMQAAGYRMHVYQSEFADFCRYSKVASCTRYWSPSMAFVEPIAASPAEKARLMSSKLIALSGALSTFANMYDYYTHGRTLRSWKLPWIRLRQSGLSGSLGGFAGLERLTADVRNAQPGELYFAHLLVPHYPYVVTRDCSVLPPSQWDFRRSLRPLKARQGASHQQMLCLASRLDRTIAAFRASPAGRGGIIVVHGDHGSRITQFDPANKNRGRISPADMIAGYSTLFAVAAPELAPGSDARPVATPDILGKLSATNFTSLEGLEAGNGRVFLDGESWGVGDQASMTEHWPAAN